jgi:putative transposase
MPNRLMRCYGAGYLHFITFSSYRRRPLLTSARRRDLFLNVLEQVRRSYRFVIAGYVVMPEHVHLLIGEPERANPSVVVGVLKQRFTCQLRWAGPASVLPEASDEGTHVWQRRFYDFVVYTELKRIEKICYIHQNPVKRGLVPASDQWAWSSFRYYAYDEAGPVLVNERKIAELKLHGAASGLASAS